MRKKAMRSVSTVRRRKVMIRKREQIGRDRWGNPDFEWRDWLPLWAKRSNLWGDQYYAAKKIDEEQSVIFELPWCEKLEELDTIHFEIVYNDESYEIKHVDLLDDGGQFIKVRALKRGMQNAEN